MKIGFIGVRPDEQSTILKTMRLRWQDVEHVVIGNTRQIPGLDLLILGNLAMSIPEQTGVVRQFWDGVIIAITAAPNDRELVDTLERNADDYIPLSVSAPEMVARIAAAIRRTRSYGEQEGTANVGDLYINMDTFEVFFGGVPLYLTPTEFRLLYHLANNRGRVVTYETLQNLVWGERGDDYTVTLRKYIQRLRVKLRDLSGSNLHIMTLARIGYKLYDESQKL